MRRSVRCRHEAACAHTTSQAPAAVAGPRQGCTQKSRAHMHRCRKGRVQEQLGVTSSRGLQKAGLQPHAWPPMSAQHVQPRQHTPRARLRVPNQHGPLSQRRPTPICVCSLLPGAASSRSHHNFAHLQCCTSGPSAPVFAQSAAPSWPCPGMACPWLASPCEALR